MFKRVSWDKVAMGRRLIDRLAKGRAIIIPGIAPEIMAWLRMQGHRYIELLTSLESRYAVKGDAFMNHVRQTTEMRLSLIQDLINLTCDEFPLRKYLDAFDITRAELGIDDRDCDPELFVPVMFFTDGEGI